MCPPEQKEVHRPSSVVVPTGVAGEGKYVSPTSQGRDPARDCSTLDAVGKNAGSAGWRDKFSPSLTAAIPRLDSWISREIRMHVSWKANDDVLRRHLARYGAEAEMGTVVVIVVADAAGKTQRKLARNRGPMRVYGNSLVISGERK